MKKLVVFLLTMTTILFVGACDSGGECPTYKLEGIASGINGDVVLQNKSNGDDLTVSADGDFVFGAELECEDDYDVIIVSKPDRLICTLTDNKGTVDKQWVDAGGKKVKLDCHPQATNETFTVGGKVKWTYVDTAYCDYTQITLQNNGADDLNITEGNFTFPTALDDGSDYNVTIKEHDESFVCNIDNSAGVINGANVTDVNITCGCNNGLD